jgi:hypothetical protein
MAFSFIVNVTKEGQLAGPSRVIRPCDPKNCAEKEEARRMLEENTPVMPLNDALLTAMSTAVSYRPLLLSSHYNTYS